MTIRTLIVDDEPLARQRIRALLEEQEDVRVIAECGDGEEALMHIEASRPDLVFLDIQMPEMTGLEVLEALEVEPMPAIVFVTAYDEYALRAFEAQALDYLLKPYTRERFLSALDRARSQLFPPASDEHAGLDARIRSLLQEMQPERKHLERFVVRQGTRIHFIRAHEVDWIEAEGNYARLHVGPKTYLLRETMTALEARLDPERFLRIHRSTIVSVDRVCELHVMFKGEYVVVLDSGVKLTSSRGYRERLQALLDGEG